MKPELTADDRRRIEAAFVAELLFELLDGLDELDGRRSDALRDELRAFREALR